MAQLTSGLGASLGFPLGVYDIPVVGLDVVTPALNRLVWQLRSPNPPFGGAVPANAIANPIAQVVAPATVPTITAPIDVVSAALNRLVWQLKS